MGNQLSSVIAVVFSNLHIVTAQVNFVVCYSSVGRPPAFSGLGDLVGISAENICELLAVLRLVVWSSGRASVFGRCAFAVLRSTCS